MTPAEELTERVLPKLKEFATTLSDELSGVSARAYTVETSEKAAWRRFELFVDCSLPERPREEPDNVALEITLDLRFDPPRFHSADVCWGHPSGQIVAELPVQGLPYSADSLTSVDAGLPRLFEALRSAVLMGHPTQPNLFPY